MKKNIILITIILLIGFGCSKKKPVIGISPTNIELGNSSQTYMGTIVDSLGGIPKYLPLTTDSVAVDSIMKEIDGIIFLGGEDVNPTWYNEEAYPCGSAGWYNQRDTSDFLMIRNAIRNNIPILAICRGCQVMNIALGGSLIQDIPTYQGIHASPEDITEILDTLNNRVIAKGVSHAMSPNFHTIYLKDDTKWLFDIAEGMTIDSMFTNHHQAVDQQRLATGITVAAMTKDSIVEVIEYKKNKFAMGVQGHPEILAPKMPRFRKFFEALIKYSTHY